MKGQASLPWWRVMNTSLLLTRKRITSTQKHRYRRNTKTCSPRRGSMSCRTDFVVGAESGQEMTKKMARKVPHNLIYTWKISQLARNR